MAIMSCHRPAEAVHHAIPTRVRADLGFCDGCRRLCAHLPNVGWRHLVAVTDNPAAPGPYVAFQHGGDECDPRWMVRL